jgi:hypothetical protein
MFGTHLISRESAWNRLHSRPQRPYAKTYGLKLCSVEKRPLSGQICPVFGQLKRGGKDFFG